MKVQFRNALLSDLPVIVDIYNTTIPSRMVTADVDPVTVESRVPWFHAHVPGKRPLWIAETEGRVAGWVSMQSFYGRPAYNATVEISIYLHPDFRGKGLGKTALAYAMEQCPSLGVENLLGFIFAHNHPSLQLFAKMGFEEWAHMPDIAELDGVKRSLKILGKKI
ncbi:MAG TPA: GNAT family N-acetyltransferase [Chitinophaga sp.]|uniref:GNAT family N-acetyltransferase n=1 Tax=Chitinophaga sp. TaxID=1869181 RepID=UPI002DB6C1E3|nr:GNAT family N-acetyltransferase [Chitinophaga sp.]HEU4555644.1 GNAT family N-acetyltransferase [Chitinophaga sp.]